EIVLTRHISWESSGFLCWSGALQAGSSGRALLIPSVAQQEACARQLCCLLTGPAGVSFAFASTTRSQRNEHVIEHENSCDNLLYRSARVECRVAVRCREPIPLVFFGSLFSPCSRSARGNSRQPRQGTRARAPQS